MSTLQFEDSEIFDNLKTILICYNCQRAPLLGEHRWYRCSSLHQICQDCKEIKEQSACLCNSPISEEHCQLTEALLRMKSWRLQCKNMIRGCNVVLEAKEMALHESECLHRLVKCAKVACKEQVAFDTLPVHMERARHWFSRSISSDCWANKHLFKLSDESIKGNFSSLPIKCELDSKVFLSVAKEKDGIFYHWMQMLGSPAEAMNYTFSVTYYGAKCNTNYEGPVVSIDVPSDEIIAGNMGFTMSFASLKSQYLDEKWSFEYSVKITNVKNQTV